MSDNEVLEVINHVTLLSHKELSQKEVFQSGDFTPIINLVRAMSGKEAKYSLDKAIDLCSAVQNLREVIYHCYVTSDQNPQYAQAAMNFLERYFYLLLFSQWVKEKFNKSDEDKISEKFIDWINDRPELTNILHRMTLG